MPETPDVRRESSSGPGLLVKPAESFLPRSEVGIVNVLSQRHRGFFECCARLTFCSYLKPSVCRSGPPTPPSGPRRRPLSGARLPQSIVLPPVASPHSVHSERRNLDVHTSHQGSFICACSPGSFSGLRSSCRTQKKKSETYPPRQNPHPGPPSANPRVSCGCAGLSLSNFFAAETPRISQEQ